MIEREPNRSRRWHWLAGTLTLLVALAAAPSLASESSTSVSVEAVITCETLLFLDICDTTADFGEGLNFAGDPVTGTSDAITSVVSPGGLDAFYVWTPSCPSGTSFIHIESSTAMESTVCASENTGTSSLRVDASRLRWLTPTVAGQPISYDDAVQDSSFFTLCSAGPSVWCMLCNAGTYDFSFLYLLHVYSTDVPGTFSSSTLWEVSS